MRQIIDRLFVGAVEDCPGPQDFAVVHACKHPCHATVVQLGDRKALPKDHPNYLSKREDWHIYLNMIDPTVPMFSNKLFEDALDFMADAWIAGKKILIHCNKGESRSPSLALLFMAKCLGVLSDESFDDAWDSYEEIRRRQIDQGFGGNAYTPSTGIETFLRENWRKLDRSRIVQYTKTRSVGFSTILPETPEGGVAVLKSNALIHFACATEIENKSHAMERPSPNVVQVRTCQAYQWLDDQGIPIRMLGLKPRQVGLSTITGEIMYHHARRYRIDGMIMADEGSRTDKVWKIFTDYGQTDGIRKMWDSVHEFNTQYCKFTYEDGTVGEWERDTANDPKAGAGGTRQAVWMSEAARYAKQGVREDTKVIGNLLSSLADVPHSICMAESTAEGASGWFYNTWTGAVTLAERMRGVVGNGWVKVFAAWHEFEEYRLSRTPENDIYFSASEKWDKFKSREKRGIMLYNWSPEQIAWRRYMIDSKLGKSENQFDQDYPEDDKVAFQASGNPRFNIEGMTVIEKQALVSHGIAERGVLDGDSGGLMFRVTGRDDDSWLWVAERPIIGCRYLGFGDPMTGEQSEGSSKRDTHACGVLRAPYIDSGGVTHPMEVVAVIDDGQPDGGCRWDMDILAERHAKLLEWYGSPKIVPEANNSGVEYIRLLRQNGVRVWQREKPDSTQPGKKLLVYGFATSSSTKPMWIEALATVIREQQIVCKYLPAASQFMTFTRGTNGACEAKPGCLDDFVAGIGIGVLHIEAASILSPPRPVEARRAGWMSEPPSRGLVPSSMS